MIHSILLLIALQSVQIPSPTGGGTGWSDITTTTGNLISLTPTLQCPKYEHAVLMNGPNCPQGKICAKLKGSESLIQVCVDDRRDVTEKEWRELMKIIKGLSEQNSEQFQMDKINGDFMNHQAEFDRYIEERLKRLEEKKP